jgi:diguanylate cyclase (GGDEF)-like protein/PAS domain S-box-containing protein
MPGVDGILSRYLAFASIRVKLWLLIVLNSSLALALAAAGMLAYQRYVQRDEAAHKLVAQADILAEGSMAPLSFDDAKAAQETLAALHGDPQVAEAIVYTVAGAAFARYDRPGAPADVSGVEQVDVQHARARPDGVYFEGDSLLTFQPVRVHGDRIGTIFLRSTTDINGQLRRYLGIMLLVVVVSLGLAMLLSSRMQGMIATPIKELSRVARQITAEKDYSVRALARSGAEIGILIESFNGMLAEIESRDLARRAAEELLRESEQRYALAARGANDGLWDWKLATNEIYFSPRWNQMLGYGDPGVRPEPEEWFSRIHPSDRGRVDGEIAAHRNGATSEFTSEYRMRHRNGSFIWMLSRGAVVRDENGRAIRMAGSQTDITEGKIGDPLTGLPNRLYFLDRLEDSIQKGTGGGIGFAVLFVDLDRFKLVNDSLGHGAGDELLMGISGRLKASVRGAGAGPERLGNYVVARLGGDEFAVLLNGIRQISEATAVAERILISLSAPFQIAGRQVFGTVSIGIAPGNGANSPEDLLRDADAAMYYAKTKGKARYEVFDEGMRDRAKARLDIETDLRKAIDLNQLVLYYQPQISLVNNGVIGYEALVRWQHPERGLVGPVEFIPIAEETDLIVPLGRWVLREACRQMALWHRNFAADPALTVSVNVSFRQLGDTNLVDEVRKALRESGLPPESLKLEMTESSIMSNPEMAIGILRQLKEIGVGLEIDDFGTGYSSLSNLSRLPFDTVKIDQSFVRDLHATGESAEIVKTILDLARSMGMSVVAEGVETAGQLGVLTSLGCDYAQGYYFSRPVDCDATQALLRERHSMRRAFAQLETPGEPGKEAKVLELLDAV